MRVPDGVCPGRVPPAAAPSPTTRSPSCACIWRAVAAPGRPRATGPSAWPRRPGVPPPLARPVAALGSRARGLAGTRERDRLVGWRRLAGDGDPEDRRRHAVADQAAELLVELERLAAELVEGVLLGVATQADAAAHVVDLGQVLDPQRVDRAQEHEPLDERPGIRPDLLLLLLEPGVDEVAEVEVDRLARAESPEVFLVGALVGQPHRTQRVRQAGHVPLVGDLAGEVLVDEGVDLLVEEVAHRVGQVLVAQDLVPLGVDRLALAVDDVVELDDALADVEVEALDAALGALDRLAHQARLDGHVVVEPIRPSARTPGPRRSASSGRPRGTGRSARNPGRPGARPGRGAGCRSGGCRGVRCR